MFANVFLTDGSSLASALNPLDFAQLHVMGRAHYIGTLNASGKLLIFDLPANPAPGDVLLNVTGSANLTGTGIQLNSASTPNLSPGQGLTLLNASSGISGFTPLTVHSSNGDIYLLNVSGAQLLAILQGLSPALPSPPRRRTKKLAAALQGCRSSSIGKRFASPPQWLRSKPRPSGRGLNLRTALKGGVSNRSQFSMNGDGHR